MGPNLRDFFSALANAPGQARMGINDALGGEALPYAQAMGANFGGPQTGGSQADALRNMAFGQHMQQNSPLPRDMISQLTALSEAKDMVSRGDLSWDSLLDNARDIRNTEVGSRLQKANPNATPDEMRAILEQAARYSLPAPTLRSILQAPINAAVTERGGLSGTPGPEMQVPDLPTGSAMQMKTQLAPWEWLQNELTKPRLPSLGSR